MMLLQNVFLEEFSSIFGRRRIDENRIGVEIECALLYRGDDIQSGALESSLTRVATHLALIRLRTDDHGNVIAAQWPETE